jgi:hypothetical protein
MTPKKFNKKETIMKNKMIKHGIAVIGIAILAFLSIACGATTPPSAPTSSTQPVPAQSNNIMQERLAQAWELSLGTEVFNNLGAGEEHWFSFQATGAEKVVVYTSGNTDTYLECYNSNNRKISENNDGGEGRNARLVINVQTGSTYLFKLRGSGIGINGPYSIIVLDAGIEEEARQQVEEARRLAAEEVNRYDPSKFTLVPSNFRPADYLSRDLFNVVAFVGGLDFSTALPSFANTQQFVSDVVFVRQDGTDIWFRTSDNAITQSMKISARSGLTSGQRVRLYYSVRKDSYSLPVWQVIAIERL